MTQREMQYAYFMNRRRQDLYRLAKLQRLARAMSRFNEIKAYVRAGGDPSKNPDIYEDWKTLVDEYGEYIFITEDGKKVITTEEDV